MEAGRLTDHAEPGFAAPSAAPSPHFWSGTPVVVTGGAGFVGGPTVRLLARLGADVRAPRSSEHDLRDPGAARAALDGAEVVIHLAANVGGIGYNLRNPGALAHDNALIGANVFEACREAGVAKLVAACSVCAYPRDAPMPLTERDLFGGYPEASNAPYGLAKRMLVVLADGYRRQFGLDACVPVLTNVYGPGDDFDLEDSHVIAAMVHRYVVAEREGDPQVMLWGSGAPTRDFLFVDDAARALLLAAERGGAEPFNVATGREVRIRDLAEKISRLAGYRGETVWDESRPDGQPRRLLDVSRAQALGFAPKIDLEEGLRRTIEDFRAGLGSSGRSPAASAEPT